MRCKNPIFCPQKCPHLKKSSTCPSGFKCTNPFQTCPTVIIDTTHMPRGSMGCFIKGTKILLGSGEEKNIDEIQVFKNKENPGDIIYSIDGSIAYVITVVEGREHLPLVKINAETDNGSVYEISMTQFHPVIIRYNFLTTANLLRKGDYLHTVQGQAMITNVEYVPYTENVYNLVLGSQEFIEAMPQMTNESIHAFRINSLLGLTPKDHVIFSNGIATADWNLQIQLKETLRGGINLSQFL